jgi:WD40 repeat protein
MSGSSLESIGGWLRFWDPRTWRCISDASMYSEKLKKKQAVLRSNGDDTLVRTAHTICTQCVRSFELAGNTAVVSGGDDRILRIWVSSPFAEVPFSPRPMLTYELGGESSLPFGVDAMEIFEV